MAPKLHRGPLSRITLRRILLANTFRPTTSIFTVELAHRKLLMFSAKRWRSRVPDPGNDCEATYQLSASSKSVFLPTTFFCSIMLTFVAEYYPPPSTKPLTTPLTPDSGTAETAVPNSFLLLNTAAKIPRYTQHRVQADNCGYLRRNKLGSIAS